MTTARIVRLVAQDLWLDGARLENIGGAMVMPRRRGSEGEGIRSISIRLERSSLAAESDVCLGHGRSWRMILEEDDSMIRGSDRQHESVARPLEPTVIR